MNKKLVIALHTAYWLCYSLLLAVLLMLIYMQWAFQQKGLQPRHFLFIQLFCTLTILPAIISFYAAYSFLMPRFLAEKKSLALTVSGMGTAVISSLLTTTCIALLFGEHFVFMRTLKGVLEQATVPFFLSVIHGVLGLVLRGFVAWFGENRAKMELQERNAQLELDLIKAHLDPHFLFNTLNNIDVLIEQDSKRASAYLQKLSGILRFMLYDTKAETMPLSEELAYIRQYLELQKIRSANPDFVRFSIEGAIAEWRIAPMLFMPFIENAFKFAEHKKSGAAITISFRCNAKECMFECENNYVPNSVASKHQSGLGTTLLKRRLELLYPNAHEISIVVDDTTYKVRLTIQNTITTTS